MLVKGGTGYAMRLHAIHTWHNTGTSETYIAIINTQSYKQEHQLKILYV